MRTGTIVSGLAHGGIIVLAVYGTAWLTDDPETLSVDISAVTQDSTVIDEQPEAVNEPVAPVVTPSDAGPTVQAARTPDFTSPLPQWRPKVAEPVEIADVAPVDQPNDATPETEPADPAIVVDQTPAVSETIATDVPTSQTPADAQSDTVAEENPGNDQTNSGQPLGDGAETPTATENTEQAGVRPLNVGERNRLRLGIDKYFSFNGDRSDRTMALVMRVELNRDGTIIGDPELWEIQGGSPAAQRAFLVAAKRALATSSRNGVFRVLPAQKYDRWKTLNFRFGVDGIGVSS